MTTRMIIAMVCILFVGAVRLSAVPVNYDFEEGAEGWKCDWGLKEEPATDPKISVSGDSSLSFEHHFRTGQESVAIRVEFEQTTDFTSDPAFKGFSAWVHFPSGSDWQAQLYVATGDEWKVSWGKLQEELKPGWHKIFIGQNEIANPALVRSIGIQVKNYRLNTKTKIYVDQVKAEF